MSFEGEIQLDKEILHRSAAGDRQAFLDFVARHQAAVLRFCRALAASNEDAEDILQETFLTAWRKASTFEGRGSARSWLFTIARRRIYRVARAPKPVSGVNSAALEDLGAAAGWGKSGVVEGLSLDKQIEVRQAFESLSQPDRQVLVLRDLEGFSNAESAEILGTELSANKSRIHRARLRLMTRLSKGANHEG